MHLVVHQRKAASSGRWLSPAVVLLDGGGTIAGPLTVTGALEAGSLTTTGTLTAGPANIAGDATVVGTCKAHIFEATAGSSFTTVTCSSLIATSSVASQGTMSVAGKITANGGIDIGAASTLTAPLTPSGAGRVRKRVLIGADSPGREYSPAEVDIVIAATLTANRTYQISSDGASDGDEIEFVNNSEHWSVTVWNGTEESPVLKNSSGQIRSCRLVFKTGIWHVISIAKA